jgi:hypothetical protein
MAIGDGLETVARISAQDDASPVFEKVGANASDMVKAVAAGTAIGSVAGELLADGFKKAVQWARELTLGAIEAADKISELSIRTNTSVATLSAWSLAAQTSGTSVEAIARSMDRLMIELSKAEDAPTKLSASFERAGIKIRDTATGQMRASSEVLLDIADRVKALGPGMEATALVAQAFGQRLGPQLLPFLLQGREGLLEWQRTAEGMALSISDATAQAANTVQDRLDVLGMASKGVGNTIMEMLLPALNATTAGLLDFVSNSNILQATGRALGAVLWVLVQAFNAVASAVIIVVGIVREIGIAITSLAAAIGAAARGEFSLAAQIIKNGWEDVKQATVDTDRALYKLWAESLPETKKAATGAADGINDLAQGTQLAEKYLQSGTGTTKTYQLTLQGLQKTYEGYVEARKSGQMSEDEFQKKQEVYVAGVRKLILEQDSAKQSTKAYADQQKDAAKAASDHAKEVDKVRGMVVQAQGVTASFLPDLQLLERYWRAGTISQEEYVAAVEALIKKQPSAQAAMKEHEASIKATDKAISDAAKAYVDAHDKADALVKKYQQEVEELKMTDLQRAISRAELELEKAGVDRTSSAWQEYIDKIRQAIIDKETVSQSLAAAKKLEEGYNQMVDNIEKSLTDSLMRGFESGKGFLDSMVDYIKNAFKQLVVNFAVQPVMKGMAQGVAGLMMGGVGTNAYAGADEKGGLAGILGGGGSPLSMLSSLGSLGGSLFGAGGLTGALGAGMGWMTGSSTLMGSLSAAGSLMGTGTAGGIMSGAAMGLGTVAPFLAAGFALYSLFKKKKSSPAQQDYSAVGSLGASGLGYSQNAPNLRSATTYEEVLSGISGGVSSVASSLGGSAGDTTYGIYTSASPDGKGATLQANVVGAQGQDLFRTWSNDSNDSLQGRIEEALPAMMLAGLQNSNLPQVFADYFSKLDLTTATQEQIDGAVAVAQAAKAMSDATSTLGGSFQQLSTVSVETRAGILALTGGLESFLQKVQGYIDTFYEQGEKASLQAQNVYETLSRVGIDTTGLDTKEEFRDLFEKLDVSTELGMEQFSAMLNVAQQFAQLVPYLEENQTTLQQLASNAPTDALTQALEQVTEASTDATSEALTKVVESSTATQEVLTVGVDELKGYVATAADAQTQMTERLSAGLDVIARGVDRVAQGVDLVVQGVDRVAQVTSAMLSAVDGIAGRPLTVTVDVNVPADVEVNGGNI